MAMQTPAPRRRRGGCIGRLLLVAGAVVVAYVVGLLFVPPVQTATRTIVLLPELIELPIRPLSALTPSPTRTTTSYGSPPDRMDVYMPADARPDRSLPAVVLVLGVHPEAIDHPDVVRVAEAISRLDVVVGVQESTALRETRIEPEEPAHLVDAALVLAGLPEVDPARIGLAGFSAGASVALIAAADPRISDELHFVSNFGGYASAGMLLVDVATRTMELEGQVLDWSPDINIRLDVLNLLLVEIDSHQRDRLRSHLEPVVRLEQPARGPDPSVEALFDGDARQAYRLFTAADRAAAEAALAGTSDSLRAELAAISPLTFAADIRAPVFTMHGDGDNAIPVSHAIALHQALPVEASARLTRFGRFSHGQPGRGGLALDDLPDVWQLTLHLHAIVAAVTE